MKEQIADYEKEISRIRDNVFITEKQLDDLKQQSLHPSAPPSTDNVQINALKEQAESLRKQKEDLQNHLNSFLDKSSFSEEQKVDLHNKINFIRYNEPELMYYLCKYPYLNEDKTSSLTNELTRPNTSSGDSVFSKPETVSSISTTLEVDNSKILQALRDKEFINKSIEWDKKQELEVKEQELATKMKIDVEQAEFHKKYFEALEDEDNKSPNSWNLKTRARLLGHDYALKYFQSPDYNERKKDLENRTLHELDIQKSRHYKPGIDFSNPSTPISKTSSKRDSDNNDVD